MIVVIQRGPVFTRMIPHNKGEPWWISAPALQYLYEYTDYNPFIYEHISEYLVNKFIELKHLRPLAEAPPTGTWLEPISRAQIIGAVE